MSNRPHAPGVPSDSILYYTPSKDGNLVCGILFELFALLLFINLIKRKDWWGLCLPIGAAFQGAGHILRIPLIDSPGSLGLFVVMNCFIVLSPACYFAYNYIWFGRLVQRIEENLSHSTKRKHLTYLPPSKFGKIFIISDIITFFIQAAGGGMQVAKKINQNIGSIIFLIGIIAQFASYVFFLSLTIPLIHSLHLFGLQEKQDQKISKRIRYLILILVFSSIFICVRCVYRTIELAQGFNGTLSQNETWLFALDSAPLLVAIGIYIFFWPCSLVELKTLTKPKLFSVPWEFSFKHSQITWDDESKDFQGYFTKNDYNSLSNELQHVKVNHSA